MQGRLELVVQRDAALAVVFGSADPISVMLLFAAGPEPSKLGERLAARRHRIEGQLEAMAAERERLTRQGVLPAMAVAAFRRGELRLEAELRWHEEFGRQLAAGGAGEVAAAGAAGEVVAADGAGEVAAAGATGGVGAAGRPRPVRAVDRR